MDRVIKYLIWGFILTILILVYAPLIYGLIYSLAASSKKDVISTLSFTPSISGYRELFGRGILYPILNSLIIAIIVSLIVAVISLATCFSLWDRRHRLRSHFVHITAQVPIINPDIITAIALTILFTLTLGTLRVSQEGFTRLIISYTVMSLPYSILAMLPLSYKFPASLYEAAQDLGYRRIYAWIRTYLIHMIPGVVASTLICFVFTFDDFIYARVVSNVTTLGTLLYEQRQMKTWILALGAILLLVILAINVVYAYWESRRMVPVQARSGNHSPTKIFVLLLTLAFIFILIIFVILLSLAIIWGG